MKKNFSVGNWFPSPVRKVSSVDSVESTQENPQPAVAQALHGFQILRATGSNSSEKVVVSYGVVMGGSGETYSPSQVDIEPQDGTKFNWGNTLYINISLSNGQPSGASISTSAGSASATKAVVTIGAISDNGVITQILTGGMLSVFSCGENSFVMNTSSYF